MKHTFKHSFIAAIGIVGICAAVLSASDGNIIGVLWNLPLGIFNLAANVYLLAVEKN